jgi:deoxycytidylate deaminase
MSHNKFISIFPRLIQEALQSQIRCQLAAALIKGQKLISKPCSNINRNICRGHACGSLHAEAHAILDYFGKSLTYSSNKGGTFSVAKDKKIKCDLIVIRINKDEKLMNSRPCYNCLSMMKAVGVKRVYYSDNNENIICENVKDMLSINSSSVTRIIDKIKLDLKLTDIEYFENLLKTLLPSQIKMENFNYFIKYDFNNVLPQHSYSFENEDGKTIVVFYNRHKHQILKTILVK